MMPKLRAFIDHVRSAGSPATRRSKKR